MVHQALSSWKDRYPSALVDGSVKLAAHDFFEKNPVIGAEVYWLRHIMYEVELSSQTSTSDRSQLMLQIQARLAR